MKRMQQLFRLAIAAALLIGLTVSAVQAQVPDSKAVKQAGKIYQRGEQALSAGNLNEARERFMEALEIAPNFPQANIGMGHVSMREGEFEPALEFYTKAKTGFADYGEALFAIESKRYANAQRRIQDMRDAISQMQTVGTAARDGNRPTTPGSDNMDVMRLENQIAQLEAINAPNRGSVAEPPGDIDFYIGNAHFRLGHLEQAVASWESCAAAMDEFPMVHNNLALGYWKLDRVEEARTSLARAEELDFPVHPQFKKDLEAAGGS